MAKRTSGEGTIYKTTRGKYRAQIVIGGRRKSKTASSAKECRDWLREQRGLIYSGTNLTKADQSLNDYLDDWLRSVQNSRKETTFVSYEFKLRLHVRPYIGHLPLSDIDTSDLQILVDRLTPEKGSGIVRAAFGTLKTALGRAAKLRILSYNPMVGVELPRQLKKAKRDMHAWDENQVIAYMSAVDHLEMRNGNLLKLAVATGLRKGELMALMWDDIDWATKEIHVVRQAPIYRDNPNDTATLKTTQSERSIPVGNVVLAILRHQEEQVFLASKAERKFVSKGFVFPNRRGDIMSHKTPGIKHDKAIVAAGLPRIRFHDLRHTAISLMLMANVPISEVSRYAGHSNIRITLDTYAHFIPADSSRAADAMDVMLTPITVDL
jgi:integrase